MGRGLVIATVLVWCGVAQALPLPAGGQEQQFWLVGREAQGRFNVFHRHLLDPPDTLRLAKTMRGELLRGLATAGGDRFWLLYTDNSLHAIVARPPALGPQGLPDPRSGWTYALSVEASPPSPEQGVVVRSLAADRDGLWALVRVESAAALAELGSESASGQATPAPRLLRLLNNRWSSLPLPTDFPPDQPAFVLMLHPEHPRPCLVVPLPAQGADAPPRVRVYRFDSDWRSETYTPRLTGELVPLAVQGQLLLAGVTASQAAVRASFAALRDGRSTELGELELKAPVDPPLWSVAAVGSTAALIVGDGKNPPTWSRLDLRGAVVQRARPLAMLPRSVMRPMTDSVVLISVLALATVILFAFWKRDPAWNKVDLPSDVELAGLLPRSLAGLIDLTPCVLLAAMVFDLDARQLPDHWPGRSGGLHAMLPGLTTIGLFLAHTTLTELFTARTLGKAMMGLKVLSLKGQPPHLWQLLGRGLLKALDLIAPPLLILPLLTPARQRLGDLVGRTVVTAAKDQQPEDE